MRSTTCAASQSGRMIGAWYVRECSGDVQWLEWEALESKIRHWMRAARVAVRAVFASERRLCELVFEGRADAPFGEAVKGAVLQLFGFAEAGQSRRPSARDRKGASAPRTSYLAPMERRRRRLAVLYTHLRPTQLSASLCSGGGGGAAAAAAEEEVSEEKGYVFCTIVRGEIIVKHRDKG